MLPSLLQLCSLLASSLSSTVHSTMSMKGDRPCSSCTLDARGSQNTSDLDSRASEKTSIGDPSDRVSGLNTLQRKSTESSTGTTVATKKARACKDKFDMSKMIAGMTTLMKKKQRFVWHGDSYEKAHKDAPDARSLEMHINALEVWVDNCPTCYPGLVQSRDLMMQMLQHNTDSFEP